MPKKKQPSLIVKIWKIIIGAIDYFVVALTPSVIGIVGLLRDDKNIISNISIWVWIAMSLVLLVLAFSKGIQRYNEVAKKADGGKSYTKRDRTKVKSSSQRGGITADTINIYGADKKLASDSTEEFPIIIPDKDGFDKLEAPFPLWNGGIPSQNKVKRYHLLLRNKGKVNTTPVHATVFFYDTNCNELTALSHERAFWFNDKPRVQRNGNEVHIIKASSSPEGICLVIQIEGTEDLYVFSDDSYFPGTGNIIFNESLKIPINEVYACINLTAQNLNMHPVWIKIVNLGKHKKPEFEILNTPPCYQQP